MPLEAYNDGIYNQAFKAFVDFAKAKDAAGKPRAIARIDAGEWGNIVNRTVRPSKGDWVGVGKWRLASLKKANNDTRDAFRTAVSNMFGGESYIPARVLEVMKMRDYGQGKPLTARRILAVMRAIDADGSIAALKALKPETRAAAIDMGYVEGELPRLALAAQFYSNATGADELAAMKAVAKPGKFPRFSWLWLQISRRCKK